MVPTTDTVRSAFLLQTLAGTRSDDVDGDDHGRGTIEIIEVSEIRYDHYMITNLDLFGPIFGSIFIDTNPRFTTQRSV